MPTHTLWPMPSRVAEVGFLNVELNALFYVNRIVDCVFFVDIFFNFFVAYRETTEKGGGWVFDNRRIAVHYVRTWFVVDLISALPTDTMLLILETSGVYSPNGIWRLLRLLRLLKLLRIFRLARIFTRWQASIGLSFAVASLLQFLVMTLLMAHWLASLWGFVGRNSGDGLLTEDAERDPLNQSWIEMAGLVELFGENSDTPVAGAFRLYGASLYVALSNIFGGSCELHPANYAEYYVQCLMMLVGSSVWAFVIGSGCGIIATLNPERIEYRQTMDQVNYFARSRKLPPQLSVRLRSFFQSTQHIFHAKRFDGLLEKMSGSLRADICSHVARKVLAKVPYFSEADVEADFLAAVALALKPRVYCPRELVRTDELVIVERGVIVRSSKIFVAGMCVGEDMIVKRETFRDSAPAIALAFVQVSTLGRSALDDLLLSFPLARARVRKAALRIATRRAFILAAQHLQKESPPSSTRTSPKKGAVLLAVAPMRIVKAEMQQESELNIEAAPGMPRRPLECCGTEERVRMIERRTDAMSRMQHDLEYKVDAIGRSMKQDMRQLTQMLAAAVGGSAPTHAVEWEGGGGGGSGGGAADGGGAAGGGGVEASAVSATPGQSSGGMVSQIRRRATYLRKSSPASKSPAKDSPGSGSKSFAPSMRRPRFGKPAQAPAGAPAATENSATSSGTSGEHDLEA